MADEQGGLGEFDELSKSRAALLAQQNRLVEMLAERNRPSAFEFYSNLARGFSDPNAKSFAQGLGSAVGNLQQEDERQKGKELQMYQIRSQLAQSQYDLDKQNSLARQLQKSLYGSSLPPVTPAEALQIANKAGLAPGPTVDAASFIRAPNQQKTMDDDLDASTKRLISMQAIDNPAKAIETYGKYKIDLALQNNKIPESQKDFEFANRLLPTELQDEGRRLYGLAKTFGKPEDAITAIKVINEAVKNNQLTLADAKQGLAIFQNRLLQFGGQPQAPASAPSSVSGSQAPSGNDGNQSRSVMRGTPQQVFSTIDSIKDNVTREDFRAAYKRQLDEESKSPGVISAPVLNTPQTYLSSDRNDPRTGFPLISPAAQEKIQEAVLTTTGQERAKAEQKIIDSFLARSDAGRSLYSEANSVFDIVNQNKKAFDVLSGPGIAPGLVKILEEAFRIGNYTMGMPAIREAIGDFVRNPDEKNAYTAVIQASRNINAAITREQNENQGAISNVERTMYAEAGLLRNDNPILLQYKSELMMAKGKFRQFLYQKINEARNRGENASDFVASPQYQRYYDSFDDSLKNLRSKYLK